MKVMDTRQSTTTRIEILTSNTNLKQESAKSIKNSSQNCYAMIKEDDILVLLAEIEYKHELKAQELKLVLLIMH